MRLNSYGKIVLGCWDDLVNHYSHVELDEFSVMPNHVHGIIMVKGDDVGAGLKPAPTKSRLHALSEIVRGFKTFSSRHINDARNMHGLPVWQRNYYERVIRDEGELNHTREYILENPVKWSDDEENPQNIQWGQV